MSLQPTQCNRASSSVEDDLESLEQVSPEGILRIGGWVYPKGRSGLQDWVSPFGSAHEPKFQTQTLVPPHVTHHMSSLS